MKFRLSHLIVLVSVCAAPVQAGFWDSIKKGLGLKSGEAVEAVEKARGVLDDASLPAQNYPDV